MSHTLVQINFQDRSHRRLKNKVLGHTKFKIHDKKAIYLLLEGLFESGGCEIFAKS